MNDIEIMKLGHAVWAILKQAEEGKFPPHEQTLTFEHFDHRRRLEISRPGAAGREQVILSKPIGAEY